MIEAKHADPQLDLKTERRSNMFPLVPASRGRPDDDQELLNELRQFVREGLTAGATPTNIREKLENAGYSEEFAQNVVNEVSRSQVAPVAPADLSPRRGRGFRNIVVGVILVVACPIAASAIQPGCISALIGLLGLAGLLLIGFGIAETAKRQ